MIYSSSKITKRMFRANIRLLNGVSKLHTRVILKSQKKLRTLNAWQSLIAMLCQRNLKTAASTIKLIDGEKHWYDAAILVRTMWEHWITTEWIFVKHEVAVHHMRQEVERTLNDQSVTERSIWERIKLGKV